MAGAITDRIIEILKERNIQAKRLCDYIGVSQSTFANWKNRETDPNAIFLPKIADFLNVSTDYLLTGSFSIAKTADVAMEDNFMNEVLQRIEALCIERDIKIATLCREVDGLNHGTYSSWKKNDRVPQADILANIADFFDVSVDFLLNGEQENTSIYSRFEQLLKRDGIKIADVSKATGISSSTFTDWRKGRYVPKQDKLQKIAKYFEVTIDWLLTGENPVNDDAPTTIIDRIYSELKVHNLKASNLCTFLGISNAQMSMWKKRKTNPDPMYLLDIATFLDVSVEYLITGNDSSRADESLTFDASDELRFILSALFESDLVYWGDTLLNGREICALSNLLRKFVDFVDVMYEDREQL